MNYTKLKLILVLSVLTAVSLFGQDSIKTIKCPKILGIAHVGYFSSDFNKAKDFYGSYLGLTPATSRKNKDGVEDMIKYKVGNIQSIEIFAEKKPDAPRYYHFAVLVENSEEMRQYLVSKGIKVPQKPIVNYANYFAYDYNGCICEMIDIRKYKDSLKNSINGISRHISEVGFIVPDMAKAIKFYCELLGFNAVSSTKGEKNYTSLKLQVGDSSDFIELTEYENKPEKADESYSNYFTLKVESIEKAEKKLKENKLADGSVVELKKLTANGDADLMLHDSDGIRINLTEK